MNWTEEQYSSRCGMSVNYWEKQSTTTIDTHLIALRCPRLISDRYSRSFVLSVLSVWASPMRTQVPDRSVCFSRWSVSVASLAFDRWLYWVSSGKISVYFFDTPGDVRLARWSSIQDQTILWEQTKKRWCSISQQFSLNLLSLDSSCSLSIYRIWWRSFNRPSTGNFGIYIWHPVKISSFPRWSLVHPQLEMLELGDETQQFVYYYHQAQEWFSTPCRRLTSLTLKNFILQTDKLQSALSQTPCLRYFKIITSSLEMMDGSRWEQMIKTKLPLLNKFEFYTRSERYRSQGNVESVLNEMIAPFRTSFWRDEKRWRVTCELVSTENRITITIYTSPMCSSQYTDLSELKTKAISNFDSNDQHSTVRLEAVTELRVQLYEILIENQVSRVKHSIKRVLWCVTSQKFVLSRWRRISFSLERRNKRSTVSAETFVIEDRSLQSEETFALLRLLSSTRSKKKCLSDQLSRANMQYSLVNTKCQWRFLPQYSLLRRRLLDNHPICESVKVKTLEHRHWEHAPCQNGVGDISVQESVQHWISFRERICSSRRDHCVREDIDALLFNVVQRWICIDMDGSTSENVSFMWKCLDGSSVQSINGAVIGHWRSASKLQVSIILNLLIKLVNTCNFAFDVSERIVYLREVSWTCDYRTDLILRSFISNLHCRTTQFSCPFVLQFRI